MAQSVVQNCTLVRFAACTVHNWIWTTGNRLSSETDTHIDRYTDAVLTEDGHTEYGRLENTL